jgi:outer membrane receptor protein involved in Fe transport
VDDPITSAAIDASCGEGVFDEEETWTWELGAKTLLFDGRLMLNGALFYIDWTNQGINRDQCIPQLPDNSPATCESNLGVDNAGESRIYGAELEVSYAATDNLTLGLDYGFADTNLEEYFDNELASFTCNQVELLSDPFAKVDCSEAGDANGKEAPFAPKQSLNLYADYQRPLTADTSWFFRTYLNYTDKIWTTVANSAHTGEAYIWDAYAGIEGDRWTVTAYVNNILDDDTPNVVFEFPFFDRSKAPTFPPDFSPSPNPNQMFSFGRAGVTSSAFVLTPRRGTQYGVTLQWRFGD